MNETVSNDRRVLVVDDHEISRRYTVAALLQSGFAVKQATGVEEAVAVACDWFPDIVFTDWHLPDGYGSDVLSGLQKYWPGGHPLPRFVLMTGESRDTFSGGIPPGFDKVLYKPCTATVLADETRNDGPCVIKETTVGETEIRQLFRQELEQRLPELDTLIANGHLSAAAAITHQLIASSQICGEQRLANRFRLLDCACREHTQTGDLAQCYSRLLTASRDFLEGI